MAHRGLHYPYVTLHFNQTMSHLQRLLLNNKITRIPQGYFQNLSNLIQLYIHDNLITHLEISELYPLDLTYLGLGGIPVKINDGLPNQD